MKFYPQDWRADERLRNCSLAARGLWMELLALMHRSERYGYLLINGKSPTDRQLSVQVGTSQSELSLLLAELEAEAVFSRDRNGTIYSRRMIRDERKAKTARENGKNGGNPKLCNATGNSSLDNPPLNLSDKTGDKAQKPEARSQNQNNLKSNSLTTSREELPEADDCTPELAFEYVCRAAEWRAANDTQRQNGIGIIGGWLALGCTLELILEGIARARTRDPAQTRSLKRFDSTIRGMRKDQLGGELPATTEDVHKLTGGVASRVSVQ